MTLKEWLIRSAAKKVFGIFGYGLHRVRFESGKYTYSPCYPYTYRTYSPWFTDWFQEIYYGRVKERTDVTADRCYLLYRFSQHCHHLEGDFAECGVYKGGTAYLIATVLKNSDRQLHLFDTFTGMPASASGDPSGHKEGDMGDVSYSDVTGFLRGFHDTAVFHIGVIPETFEAVKDKKFAFVHVDVDLYRTTKDCCSFFYSRLVRGGVMIFDDYGFPRYEFAAKQAVDEFFSDKPEKPISLRTGQCLVIKQ